MLKAPKSLIECLNAHDLDRGRVNFSERGREARTYDDVQISIMTSVNGGKAQSSARIAGFPRSISQDSAEGGRFFGKALIG